ncbi:MAG: WD40 repeat domain-containing serine/threonine protein kinase [Myxococcota bacterium]
MSTEDRQRKLNSETFIFQEGDSHRVDASGGEADDARVARYRLAEELGRGGLGEVHTAHDLLLVREVALKASLHTDKRILEQFWHEARVTAVLDHPNIVTVYDAGTLGTERPFFTMKRIEGKNLAEAVTEGPPMSLREKLDIFRSVCDAVQYAHSKRWMHRDLKPDNVMLGPFGEVLVVDWGLAASLDAPRPPKPAGTPRYMAPEQARGEAQDERADIYALGGILWFLLSGEDPWHNVEDFHDVMSELRQGSAFIPDERESVPRELRAIVVRALEPRPEDRYPTARALKSDVLAFLDGQEVGAASYTASERLAKWADRHRGRLLVGLAVSTAVLGLIGVSTTAVGFALYRSMQVARGAAERAETAEAATKDQLVEALVAGSAADVGGERYTSARDTLVRADAMMATRPMLGLAWSDVTTRGVWPVARVDTPGGTPGDLAVTSAYALLTRADGRWETRDLRTGELRSEGTVPGRPLLAVDADTILSVDGADLVLAHVFKGELARTARPDPDQRVEHAWKAGNRVVVQAYEDGSAPPASAWTLPDLAPSPLPSGLKGVYVQDVSPWGTYVLGSTERRPDLTLPGEVRVLSDGALSLSLPQGIQGFLGRETFYRTAAGAVEARSLTSRTEVWERPGFAGVFGVETRAGVVVIAAEEGTILVLDARTGEERALLLGLDQRPVDVDIDREGRWVVATGVDGRIATWALPQTPTAWWRSEGVYWARAHPEGRLLAVARPGSVEVLDVPSATTVVSIEATASEGRPVWSPDGLKLLFGDGDGGRVVDVTTLESRDLPEGVGVANAVWGSEQLVVSHAKTGIVRLDPETLEVRDRFPEAGSSWSGIELEDGSVVFGANKRTDAFAGVRVPVSGEPVLLAGGSEEVVGFGARAIPDGTFVLARQDGRLLRFSESGEPLEPWSWQSAPVLDAVPVPGGLVAVTFDGRVHALDGAGNPLYTMRYSREPLYLVERVGAQLVVGGRDGIRTIPLDGHLPESTEARLLRAHAWSLVPTDDLTPEDRLTVALGRGEGVLEALEGREDSVGAILRAAARR